MIGADNLDNSYNGLSIYNKGIPISKDEIYILNKNIISPKNNHFRLGNTYYFNDYKYKYYNYLNNYIEKANLNLLIDLENGNTSYFIKDILGLIECKYNLINDKPNGTNINLNYNKEYIINLKNNYLNDYDLIAIFNGSGSEINIILNDGNIIYNDEINTILNKYYLDINYINNGLLELLLIIKLLNKGIILK